MGGWSSWTMRKSAAIGGRSKYGGWPVKNSSNVQPTFQISAAGLTPLSSMISGANQYGLPTTSSSLGVALDATPKSLSFSVPSFVVKIFAALMSR